MNNFEEQLKSEAQKIRLSQREKDSMRARVFDVLAQEASAPSPYFMFSFQFQSVARYALTAFVLVVFVSGGTVSAAHGALPGDLLYPIKISVNESVEQALATSPSARAAVHTKLAQRRLEEAETLTARNALSAEVAAQIEENFDTHVKSAGALALELEEEDPGTAAEVKVTLDSSLSAHAELLAALGEESDDENTREHSGRLSARLLARTESAQQYGFSAASARMQKGSANIEEASTPALTVQEDTATSAVDASIAMTMQAPPPASEGQVRAALSLAGKASTTLARAKNTFEEKKDILSERVLIRGEAELQKLDALMAEGKSSNAAGDIVGSIDLYLQVLRGAVALQTYLDAKQNFDRDFIPSFLRGDDVRDVDESAHNENDEEEKGDGSPDYQNSENDPQEGEEEGGSATPGIDLPKLDINL